MNRAPVLTFALFAGTASLDPVPPAEPVLSVSPVPLPKEARPKSNEDPMRGMDLAKKAVAGFLSASSVEEMAKFVRDPQRALPRMKAYYKAQPPQPVKFTMGADWSEVDRDDRTFLLGKVTVEFDEVFICTEIPFRGDALVDWESYTGWCEMPWTEFVTRGSEKPVECRVVVSASDYFNFSYTDSEKYACFRLTDKADNETVFAYCEKGSKLHRKIEAALKHYGPGEDRVSVPCILSLKMKAGDAVHRQAVIESLEKEGWVDP
jgi:hypothetical protein